MLDWIFLHASNESLARTPETEVARASLLVCRDLRMAAFTHRVLTCVKRFFWPCAKLPFVWIRFVNHRIKFMMSWLKQAAVLSFFRQTIGMTAVFLMGFEINDAQDKQNCTGKPLTSVRVLFF